MGRPARAVRDILLTGSSLGPHRSSLGPRSRRRSHNNRSISKDADVNSVHGSRGGIFNLSQTPDAHQPPQVRMRARMWLCLAHPTPQIDSAELSRRGTLGLESRDHEIRISHTNSRNKDISRPIGRHGDGFQLVDCRPPFSRAELYELWYVSRKPVNHSINRSRITTSETISPSSSINDRSGLSGSFPAGSGGSNKPISTRCR
jgi:hypothetical protein